MVTISSVADFISCSATVPITSSNEIIATVFFSVYCFQVVVFFMSSLFFVFFSCLALTADCCVLLNVHGRAGPNNDN